jgi:hypothetical protein
MYVRQQIPKTCGACGQGFRGKSNQKYCSRDCAQQRQREQLAALTESRRHCPHCGQPLSPKSGRRRQRPANGRHDETVMTPAGDRNPMRTPRNPMQPNKVPPA